MTFYCIGCYLQVEQFFFHFSRQLLKKRISLNFFLKNLTKLESRGVTSRQTSHLHPSKRGKFGSQACIAFISVFCAHIRLHLGRRREKGNFIERKRQCCAFKFICQVCTPQPIFLRVNDLFARSRCGEDKKKNVPLRYSWCLDTEPWLSSWWRVILHFLKLLRDFHYDFFLQLHQFEYDSSKVY